MDIKNILRTNLFHILVFGVMTLVWYMSLDICQSYLDGNPNKIIYGNCEMLIERETARLTKDGGFIDSDGSLLIPPTDRKIIYMEKNITIERPCPPIIMNKTCPPCIQKDCVCTCPICTTPACPLPEHIYNLTDKQIKWLNNECKPHTGHTAYQSGYHDACDDVRRYLQVPGRSKFASRPSTKLQPTLP